MTERTTMIRRYDLEPGTGERFLQWWSQSIPPLRERSGFTIEWAYLDREHEIFTWALSYPGDAEAFRSANAVYEALPEREAAIAVAPPLAGVAVGFADRVR